MKELAVHAGHRRRQCIFCGKGWFLIRWSAWYGPSVWVCLHHTRRFLRGA